MKIKILIATFTALLLSLFIGFNIRSEASSGFWNTYQGLDLYVEVYNATEDDTTSFYWSIGSGMIIQGIEGNIGDTLEFDSILEDEIKNEIDNAWGLSTGDEISVSIDFNFDEIVNANLSNSYIMITNYNLEPNIYPNLKSKYLLQFQGNNNLIMGEVLTNQVYIGSDSNPIFNTNTCRYLSLTNAFIMQGQELVRKINTISVIKGSSQDSYINTISYLRGEIARLTTEYEERITELETLLNSSSVNYNEIIRENQSLTNELQTLQNELTNLRNQNNILLTNIRDLQEDLNDALQGNNSLSGLLLTYIDIPIKVISGFLGFEIFGVEVFKALTGLLTMLLILYLIKKVL